MPANYCQVPVRIYERVVDFCAGIVRILWCGGSWHLCASGDTMQAKITRPEHIYKHINAKTSAHL